MGSILAVIVILAFLRQLVPTVIIALSIPISVVVTFAPMYIGGVSLNIMSLGGLALGVGMLVDNAIVVLESITRCRSEGDSLRDAAVRGTRGLRLWVGSEAGQALAAAWLGEPTPAAPSAQWESDVQARLLSQAAGQVKSQARS